MNIVAEWLEENFDNESTKTSYRSHLKSFKKFLKEAKDEEDLERYVGDVHTEEFADDFAEFVDWVNGLDLSPKTINDRLTTVKMFFLEHGVEFPEAEWKRLRRRKIPPDQAQTQDRAGTKEEWKRVLNNLSIEGRSLVLFLLTTGCRIGETLQLKRSDLDLDSDPPEARIRGEYTKNDRPRTVYFTEEAKEAIQNWLEYRERSGLKKKTRLGLTRQEKENLSEEEQRRRLQSLRKMQGKFSESERIWPIAKRTAYDILARALEKADLEERDEQTNRRKLHFHSCRKYFKTHMRGMDEDVVEYLLGHLSGIRGTYRKYEESDIPKEQYKEHCDQLRILEPKTGPDLEKMRDMEIEILRTTLKTHGISEAKIDRVTDSFVRERSDRLQSDLDALGLTSGHSLDSLNLGELSEKEYQELKDRLLELVQEKQEPQQRLVEQDEFEEYLDSGWRYVAENGEKVIVESTPGAEEPVSYVEKLVAGALNRELGIDLEGSEFKGLRDEDKKVAVDVVRLSDNEKQNPHLQIRKSVQNLERAGEGWERILAIHPSEIASCDLEGMLGSVDTEDIKVFLISEDGNSDRID